MPHIAVFIAEGRDAYVREIEDVKDKIARDGLVYHHTGGSSGTTTRPWYLYTEHTEVGEPTRAAAVKAFRDYVTWKNKQPKR